MKTLKEVAEDSMVEAGKRFKTKGDVLGMVEGMTESMNKGMKERVEYLKSLSPEDQKKAMREGRQKMTKKEYLALPVRDGTQTLGTICRMFSEDKVKEDAPAPVLELLERRETDDPDAMVHVHMKAVWIIPEEEIG